MDKILLTKKWHHSFVIPPWAMGSILPGLLKSLRNSSNLQYLYYFQSNYYILNSFCIYSNNRTIALLLCEPKYINQHTYHTSVL